MGYVKLGLIAALAATSVAAAPKRQVIESAVPPPPPASEVTGQAFIQTSSGTPRTCAGQDDVLLLPEPASGAVTAYFGSDAKGFVPEVTLPFAPAEPTKTAPCDAAGTFKFTGLASGYYFVVSHVTWAGGEQGGWLMKRVDATPGGKTDVILSATVDDAPPVAKVPARDPREVVAEQAVRAQLFDPSSAQFDWPGRWNENVDFKFWRWSKPIHGDFTCGKVNARNRFGGYVGEAYVAVVVSDDSVSFMQMDSSGDSIGLVGMLCHNDGF